METSAQSSRRKIVRPSTIVRMTRPWTGRPSNGAFFDFERNSSVEMRHAPVGIEQHQIGRRARFKPPDWQPQDLRRVAGQPRDHVEQAQMTVVVQFERQRQQGFEPDDAVGGRAERQPLRILVPRRMVAGDRVDRAVAQPVDDGAAVPFAAQRRRQLGESPVVADRGLVQREIGRSRVAGHLKPLRLRPADRLDPSGGREMGGVVARAGDLDEAQVALDHDHLGRRRDRGEPEPGARSRLR